MAVRKVQKIGGRSCEAVNQRRAKDLAGYGSRSAMLAKSKGKGHESWEAYCPLLGDNNKEAWRVGWDSEFNK